MNNCPNCGAELEPAGHCPACGANVFTVVAGQVCLEGAIPTVISGGQDAATGDILIKVDAPTMRSVVRTTPEGQVSLTVTGAEEIGKHGEARARITFCEKLRLDGFEASLLRGVDGDGEDGILLCGGQRYVLQVTMALRAPDYWSTARVESATTEVEIQGAVSWIREGIERKADSRILNMVLLLDACHAVPVTSCEVINSYLDKYGSPAKEFGFSSVYLVGPAAMFCSRLGDGTP